MTDAISCFLTSLVEMEDALVANDVARVRRLMDTQQTRLMSLVEQAKEDGTVATRLRECFPEIQQRIALNAALLKQGLAVSEAVLRTLVDPSSVGNTKTGYTDGRVRSQRMNYCYTA